MALIKRAAWLSWIIVGLLAVSCCVLAVLQYRWISEFTAAEQERLKNDLQSRLNLVARSFDEQISGALSALVPPQSRIDQVGRKRAYAERMERYHESPDPFFRRIALAIPGEEGVTLQSLNLQDGKLSPGAWPEEWLRLRERLERRINHRPGGQLDAGTPTLLDVPRFGDDGEQEWLIAELDLDRIRDSVLPELLNRYVSTSAKPDYDWEVLSSPHRSVLFHSANFARVESFAEATVGLLRMQSRPSGPDRGGFRPGPPDGPEGSRGPRPFPGPPPERSARGDDHSGPPSNFNQGRWLLLARHHSGALDSLVAPAKWRNLAASGGLMLLIIATVAALLRAARQSQRLAAAQMNFVANVSHELRTPLTVIRTAAFNLRGRLAHQPEQVERYGRLIQEHSEKLTALVEQVLRFARSQAGHVIGERESVPIGDLIESSLESSRVLIESNGITVEKHLRPDLPPVLADKLAITHALQNLIENAVKYGTQNLSTSDSCWLGIYAAAVSDGVEIRVADRGPGIPPEEQARIFDPFFRGRRAISDQVHGTGLGLSLVKKIIEAHGGSIRVESRETGGAEFILRIPAPMEPEHELAHSLG